MAISLSATSPASVQKPSEAVWQVMQRFGDLSWTTGIDEVIVEGEGIGMVRKVRLTGSTDWIIERLIECDNVNTMFSTNDQIMEQPKTQRDTANLSIG